MSNPDIRLVNNKDIDPEKWDECIRNSAFGIAYAYSWYLDRICPDWDALIWGNYLYVMPLPHSKKYGLSYVYQPFFTQQLGVFSNFSPEPEIVNHFLHAIPEEFRLTDLKLNLGNEPTSDRFRIEKHITHHLNLSAEIEKIHAGYNTNTSRNIQKAIKHKISVLPIFDINQFLEFTQANLKEKSPEVKPKHYSALKKVISYSLYNQVGKIYGAFDSSNTLVAATFFVTTNQKSIYLAASSNAIGTRHNAMFLLIDTFIMDHAENNLVLDFEGSDIAGVARFYKGFGGIPQTYYSVHQNRLPRLIRLLKK